jgi:hypothetical protein
MFTREVEHSTSGIASDNRVKFVAGKIPPLETPMRLSVLVSECNSAEAKAAHSLAVHLLSWCVDSVDLEDGLARIDAVLADRLADMLLGDVDFDRRDWAGGGGT